MKRHNTFEPIDSRDLSTYKDRDSRTPERIKKLAAGLTIAGLVTVGALKYKEANEDSRRVKGNEALTEIANNYQQRITDIEIGKKVLFHWGVNYYATPDRDRDVNSSNAIGSVKKGDTVVVSNPTIVIGEDGRGYYPASFTNVKGEVTTVYFPSDVLGQHNGEGKLFAEFENSGYDERISKSGEDLDGEAIIGIFPDGTMWYSTTDGPNSRSYQLSKADTISN